MLPTATEVTDALCDAERARVHVQPLSNSLIVDTPHLLQTGETLRVFIESVPAGLLVHEGGLVLRDLDVAQVSARTWKAKQEQLRGLAQSWDLSWRGRFEFLATNITEVAGRIAILAIASDQAITMLGVSRPSRRQATRKQFAEAVRLSGLGMEPRKKIALRSSGEVTVDWLITAPTGRVALVEYMEGTAPESAHSSVDHAIVNLLLVKREAEFAGDLVGVYDDTSFAADDRYLSTFQGLMYGAADLMPTSTAPSLIAQRLLHAA